jgi:uncharacterized peroxidase-related enzyme
MKLLKKTATMTALALSLTLNATAGESLIPYTSVKDAKGEIKAIYDQVQGAFGMVPAPLQQHSVSPEVLKAVWAGFGALHNKNFSDKLQAMMRMTVASAPALDCDYCIGLNESMLINMFKMDMKEINAVKQDPHAASSLNEKDKKMLIFMVESTTKPKEVNKAQIDELRTLGWSDKDIFDGLKMATNMVAMTLMVDTLKIPRDF